MATFDPHDAHHGDGLLAGSVVDPQFHLHEAERARARRRRQRIAATIGAFLTFVALAALVAQVGFSDSGPGAGTAAPKVAVQSEAAAVLLIRPGRDPQRIGLAKPVVGVAATSNAAHAAFELPEVGTVARATATARSLIGRKSATATATVEQIHLFDGRVQITGARMTADATSANGRASGSLTLDPATKLVVDGVERASGINERIAVEGIGTVIVNEQAVISTAPRGDAQTGPRHRVVGAIAHVRITTDTAGLPAGSELVIGRVDAGVREGKVRKVEHPAPGPASTPPSSGIVPGLQQGTPAPGEGSLPRRPVGVRANTPATQFGNLQGYLFPILGRHSYTNDWGAPRASTGIPHQGNDLFADEGTPIVAITDGVLDRVGWNSIGGYRFWLFDQYGNSFYHAHLSAFSPIAQDGARVRRGDVIGFVGHTGDAQFTPPHLHFEVHPNNGDPTNPFPFLNGWKRGVVVAIGLLTGGPDRVAPLSLLGFTDISANSGLQDSILDSVPDTRARSIEQETAPRPTDETLKGAIEGPGTSAR